MSKLGGSQNPKGDFKGSAKTTIDCHFVTKTSSLVHHKCFVFLHHGPNSQCDTNEIQKKVTHHQLTAWERCSPRSLEILNVSVSLFFSIFLSLHKKEAFSFFNCVCNKTTKQTMTSPPTKIEQPWQPVMQPAVMVVATTTKVTLKHITFVITTVL